ncbi:ubiquitin carboxyl-terminal hydrolase 4 [Schizophyllum fasciatum]
MPGISVLPSPPSGIPPSSQALASTSKSAAAGPVPGGSGGPREDDPVSEIKKHAQDAVIKETRGASAISLLRSARTQTQKGKDHEARGELKEALSAYAKATALALRTIEHKDLLEEKKDKGGVLHDYKDLPHKIRAVEEKLRAIELASTRRSNDNGDGFKSLKDRIRSLEASGLNLPTGRSSAPSKPAPTPPTSPKRLSVQNTANSFASISSPPLKPTTPSSNAPLTFASQSHAFVSPASLGPPSPASSPSSSPLIPTNGFSISEFSTNFPSIDELDESFGVPSLPTGISNGSAGSHRDQRTGDSKVSPSFSIKNLPLSIERPSSTPIPPTVNTFTSRPASPSKPPIPRKPSNLSINNTPSTRASPIDIPKSNSTTPRELRSYLHERKVLLIDVRNQSDFEREHIKASAIVCIEPIILQRANVTADTIDDALNVSAGVQLSCFRMREKFDLVVMYDHSSTSFGRGSPLYVLYEAIFVTYTGPKTLKRPPMMLVGGIEAWRRDFGAAELTSGSSPSEALASTSLTASTSLPISKTPSSNGIGSPPLASSSSNPPAFDSRTLYRSRADTHSGASPSISGSIPPTIQEHRSHYSLDQSAGHMRSPAESSTNGMASQMPLSRRPAMKQPMSTTTNNVSSPRLDPATKAHSDQIVSPSPTLSYSTSNGGPISYPQYPRSAIGPGSSTFVSAQNGTDIASPPQASIPAMTRRRSDFVDQSQEALMNLPSRQIDYPELVASQSIRPPPAAASPALERQASRPWLNQRPSFSLIPAIGPPRISSQYPVVFWGDDKVGVSGLKNLGNTCYANAPLQCLSATIPFAQFFKDTRWKNAINMHNSMGSKGVLSAAFAALVHQMWSSESQLIPSEFMRAIRAINEQYKGSDQHDSQEFLSFLLDGIHEDLNRILKRENYTRTPEQEAELERLPPQIASEQEWQAWRLRNDSIIVDYFQGQLRNQVKCLTCGQTSTTYNTFSILSLPVPHARAGGKAHLKQCLDAFFNSETLEKDDAWDCPRCKTKRSASKSLMLARLPPVLVIHMKRFEAHGRFSDKIDTFVDFPVKGLDLTSYMPPPLPMGADKSQLNGAPMSPDDPRTQLPPYRYDLYGVTNHFGNLSSGHYTASISSGGRWYYCDDSVTKELADSRQVVSQKAYVLFYKRVKA